MRQLLAYLRVTLDAGASQRVSLDIPAARFGFHDRSMTRVVEPGAVQVWLGRDCDHPATDIHEVQLTGGIAPVTNKSARLANLNV
jgi:beta-glucosidase